MERLLVCHLTATGCVAEAVLNGIPVARTGPAGGAVVVPVHEYTRSGANTLSLVIAGGEDPATPRGPAPDSQAEARLLLPRIGHAIDPDQVRTLASVGWQQAAAAADSPRVRTVEVELPVSFPRWRWLDAPVGPVTPALQTQLLAWLQQIARDLAAGDPESFLAATRLRTEELALAYQGDPDAETVRLRDHLLGLQAGGALVWTELTAETFRLRPIAEGRLLECQSADGAPALATLPGEAPEDGGRAFPLRLAVVEGSPYVLR